MTTIEKEWTTNAGLEAACIMVRDSHRCGYVRVPDDHPLHGVDWSEADFPEADLEVHGGVTFTGPHPLTDSGWWIGFDCAHAGDAFGSEGFRIEGVHRSLEYVIAECEKLARQIKEINPL